jgi:hypothetical protein
MDSIRITTPLWGGYRLFNWGRREPFIALSISKLVASGEKVAINLEYLHRTVERQKKDLVESAQRYNWVGSNGRLPCYYYPESYLLTGDIAE